MIKGRNDKIRANCAENKTKQWTIVYNIVNPSEAREKLVILMLKVVKSGRPTSSYLHDALRVELNAADGVLFRSEPSHTNQK